MGNKECCQYRQRTDQAMISLIFTQPYYIAGEDIVGKIKLQIFKDFPLRKLILKIYGFEQVSVFRKIMKTDLLKEEQILDEAQIDNEINALLPKMLKPGDYEYQFSISTKKARKLPSTTNSRIERGSCQIAYFAECCCESFNKEIPCLGIKKSFQLLEKLKPGCNKCVSKNTIVKNGNKEYGPANMRVRLDYTGIIVDMGFEICIDYDNSDCQLTVQQIKAKIIQKVSIHIDAKASPLIEEKVIAEWELPGVQKGEKAFVSNRLCFETGTENFVESVNGINCRKCYMLLVEPIYKNNKKGLCVPRIEFEVNVTNTYQPRNKQEIEDSNLEAQKENKNDDEPEDENNQMNNVEQKSESSQSSDLEQELEGLHDPQ